MPMGILFWVLMLLWLIFGAVLFWPSTPTHAVGWGPFGYQLLIFFLLALLGWRCFGSPVQGSGPR